MGRNRTNVYHYNGDAERRRKEADQRFQAGERDRRNKVWAIFIRDVFLFLLVFVAPVIIFLFLLKKMGVF